MLPVHSQAMQAEAGHSDHPAKTFAGVCHACWTHHPHFSSVVGSCPRAQCPWLVFQQQRRRMGHPCCAPCQIHMQGLREDAQSISECLCMLLKTCVSAHTLLAAPNGSAASRVCCFKGMRLLHLQALTPRASTTLADTLLTTRAAQENKALRQKLTGLQWLPNVQAELQAGCNVPDASERSQALSRLLEAAANSRHGMTEVRCALAPGCSHHFPCCKCFLSL